MINATSMGLPIQFRAADQANWKDYVIHNGFVLWSDCHLDKVYKGGAYRSADKRILAACKNQRLEQIPGDSPTCP